MVFIHIPIPRKGSGKQQQQSDFLEEPNLQLKQQVATGKVKQSKCSIDEKATKSYVDEEEVCPAPWPLLRYSVPFEKKS